MKVKKDIKIKQIKSKENKISALDYALNPIDFGQDDYIIVKSRYA